MVPGVSHTYTWDAEGRPVTIGAIGLTYDALGQMVQEQNGTTFTEYVYALGEKLALMNGQTQTKAFVPLPGGTQVKYTGTTISTYRLPDWLGSLRVGSNPNRTYSRGVAFAPYGERYATSGSPAWTFTGQTADVVSDEYDFMFREYHSTQGRWISPDPAGMAAVTLGNPQSWNRYAYVINNPLSLIDPSGLDFCIKALLDAAGNVMACFDEPGDLGHRGNFWGGWGPGDFGDGGSGVGFNGGFSGGPSGSWGEQPPVPLAPSPLIPANIMQVLNFVLFNQPLDWNSVLWGTNCMPFCDVGPTANNGQQNPQQLKPVKPCTADAMANSVQHAQQTYMKTFGKTEAWALGLAVTFGCKAGPWGCALGVEAFLVNQPAILTTAAIKGSFDAYKEAFTNPTHACE